MNWVFFFYLYQSEVRNVRMSNEYYFIFPPALLFVGLCNSPRRLSAVLRTEQKPAYSYAIQRSNFLSQRTFEGESVVYCVYSIMILLFYPEGEDLRGVLFGVF